ncbi:hypothetical protein CIK74_16665 [Glutamicibacter sp. BW77]|nr:hypothetical protein CIK74_16665 [Glutamicibacter sp. BW77]
MRPCWPWAASNTARSLPYSKRPNRRPREHREDGQLLPRLGKYTEGAGCVYVKKLEDIDLEILRQLIKIAFARAEGSPRTSRQAYSDSSIRLSASLSPAEMTGSSRSSTPYSSPLT